MDTTTLLIAITVALYFYVFGRLHERHAEVRFGHRCDLSAMGWWYRKPEFRDLYHPDQDGIEPSDFKPLQGICMEAHFGVKTPRMDFRAPVLRPQPVRWRNNA
jgi:hypothetical protein